MQDENTISDLKGEDTFSTIKQHSSANHKSITKVKEGDLFMWQSRLLPWMIIVPTVLMMAFIILATLRMSKFESFIYGNERSLLENRLPALNNISSESISNAQLEYLKFYTLAQMEQYSINKRYNQAGAITMSTIYTKYLGFFTGMILTIVGAVFIISKLQEQVSNVEGNLAEQVRFKLLSSSPGIIFGVLGTLLMTITIVNKGEVKVDDAPLFLNHFNLLTPDDYISKSQVDSNKVNALPTDTAGKKKRITPKDAENVDLDK